MDNVDYKAAYERQKKARELAEKKLEDKSRELFGANESLISALNRIKNQKSKILHNEKLASIGQLSAGVAHEINNPMGYIKSNLNSLSDYVGKLKCAVDQYEKILVDSLNDSGSVQAIRENNDLDFICGDVDDLLSESMKGVERVVEIVADLKSFARPVKEGKEYFSVKECIVNTLRLVENEVKYKADLLLDLDDVPNTYGQSGAISQVVLNLVVNAADAIEENGEICISLCVENDQIKLTVKDNGAGIPQTIITRIFDPFFTTKDVDKGTGLGLAISYGIIKSHKGQMNVFSEEGKGTTFTILLPIVTSGA